MCKITDMTNKSTHIKSIFVYSGYLMKQKPETTSASSTSPLKLISLTQALNKMCFVLPHEKVGRFEVYLYFFLFFWR